MSDDEDVVVAPKKPGRQRGVMQKVSRLAREEAKAMGLLPHEWLLKVMRGEPIEQRYYLDILDKKGNRLGRELIIEEIYPDLPMRHDAAKAAAPYYAPKLASHSVDMAGSLALQKMSDEEIDSAIADLVKFTRGTSASA